MSRIRLGLSLVLGAALIVGGAVQSSFAQATAAPANSRIAYVVASEPVGHGIRAEFPGPGRIETSAPDGSATRKLPRLKGHSVETVEYSPDGKQIAWISTASGRESKRDGLYVAAADGSDARQVVETSWTNDFGWSADGTSLVYCEVISGVYSVPTDGTGKPKLIHDTPESGGTFDGFTAAPDGSGWVFEENTEGPGGNHPGRQLWRMNADGSGASPLFARNDAPKFAGEPDFSPDGQTLVFTDRTRERWRVMSVPFGQTTFTTLYTAPKGSWVDGPAWSPDGMQIAVGVGRDGYRKPTRLLTIDVSTKTTKTVRKAPAGAISDPTWAPAP